MAVKYFDAEEIRKAISVLKPNGELFEIRIQGEDSNVIVSGYYTDVEPFLRDLKRQDLKNRNVYITVQRPKEECYSRLQRDCLKASKTTTKDGDVEGYEWLFVDIDPERVSKISSTDKQIEEAKAVAKKVYQFMLETGFERPVVAMSGNGVHLLYRISLQASEERKQLIKDCLDVLDMFFSTEQAGIDISTFNQSRVCKLYGTLAQKGANTPERPHRMSKILSVPEEIKVTDIAYLQKLADMKPKMQEPKDYKYKSGQEFDVRDWLTKNGLHFRESSWMNGEKLILDCCPFDSSHVGKDAAVIRLNNGALKFHCFHRSCQDKDWRDLRLKFEPDAYERKNQAEVERIYGNFNRNAPKKPVEDIKQKDGEPIFLSPMDIYNMPPINEAYIRTGFNKIDKRLRGLQKGRVSLLSGLRGAAKSTILSQLILTAVDTGNNVACFSGELSPRNFQRWMMLQAAGKPFVSQGATEYVWNVERKYQKVIAEWLDGHFWLYNNEYGNNFEQILKEFDKAIDEKKLDLLVLDNLMAFNISTLSESKFDAQTQFVLSLTSLAKKKNVHILFVAHPRKSLGFLRLQDVSGSADLANAVDYAFIAHRNNEDFRRLTMQDLGWKEGRDIYNCTNVIEIAKDRDGGTQDEFVPLWFEQETKRLKNDPTETKFYGWCKQKEPEEEEFDLGIDDWEDSGETPFDAE